MLGTKSFFRESIVNHRIAVRARIHVALSTACILGTGIGATRPLSAQTDACALIKAVDAASLLGGTATATPAPKGTTCTWKVADPQRKLIVLTYSSRTPGEMAYAGARRGAEGDAAAKITDESGLGDKAFSTTPAFGAAFIMLKHGRLLQLQYWTGTRRTGKERDDLRAVARKAIAAF